MDGHNKHTGDAIIRGEEYTVQLVAKRLILSCLLQWMVVMCVLHCGSAYPHLLATLNIQNMNYVRSELVYEVFVISNHVRG